MAKKKKGKGHPSKVPAGARPVEATASEAETKDQLDEPKDEAGESGGDADEADVKSMRSQRPLSRGSKKSSPPSSKVGKSAGVLALYDHPNTILRAAEKARDQGFEKWDVYTPFPVHGMDLAMGLKRSPVPWVTFIMGVLGCAAAIIVQFGTMVYSWPLNFGGKPFAAWPSFVPITFETTVYWAGVSTAIGALALGGMFKFKKRKPHPDVTSHRFAIFVEATDPKYDEAKTLSLFENTGAIEVCAVKEGE